MESGAAWEQSPRMKLYRASKGYVGYMLGLGAMSPPGIFRPFGPQENFWCIRLVHRLYVRSLRVVAIPRLIPLGCIVPSQVDVVSLGNHADCSNLTDCVQLAEGSRCEDTQQL